MTRRRRMTSAAIFPTIRHDQILPRNTADFLSRYTANAYAIDFV